MKPTRKQHAQSILARNAELAFTAAYGAYQCYRLYLARRGMAAVTASIARECASKWIYDAIGAIRDAGTPDVDDASPGQSASADRRVAKKLANAASSGAFGLAKGKGARPELKTEEVPGRPTYVVLYLEAIPEGATLTTAPPQVVDRLDAHLAAARAVVLAAKDPATMLRSSEFIIVGLDDTLQPIGGNAHCGRVVGLASALGGHDRERTRGRRVAERILLGKVASGAHPFPVRPDVCARLPPSLIRDFMCIAVARHRRKCATTMHRVHWIVDRLAAVESNTPSFMVALVRRFAPDGFPSAAPVLDVEKRLVVPPPTPAERDAGLSAAQQRSIEAFEANATRTELIVKLQKELSQLEESPLSPDGIRCHCARDPRLRHFIIPRAIVEHQQQLKEASVAPAFLSPDAGGAVSGFLSLVREVGAVKPLLVFAAATIAKSVVRATSFFTDASYASRRWGRMVNLQQQEGEGSALGRLPAVTASAATIALVANTAELVSSRAVKILGDRIDVGLNARMVLSIVTADLAGLDQDSLKSIRDGRGSLSDQLQSQCYFAGQTLSLWTNLASVGPDLVAQPVAVVGVAALTLLSVSPCGDIAVHLTPWIRSGLEGDRTLLDPSTNPAYATAGCTHGTTPVPPHSLLTVARSGSPGAMVFGSAMLRQKAPSMDQAAVPSFGSEGADDMAKTVPWAFAHSGLSLLIATAVHVMPPGAESSSALASVAAATRWPSFPPALATATQPVLARIAHARPELAAALADVTRDQRDFASAARTFTQRGDLEAAAAAARAEAAKMRRKEEFELRSKRLTSLGVPGKGSAAHLVLTRLLADDNKWYMYRSSGVDTLAVGIALEQSCERDEPDARGVLDASVLDNFCRAALTSAYRRLLQAAERVVALHGDDCARVLISGDGWQQERDASSTPTAALAGEARRNKQVQRALTVGSRISTFYYERQDRGAVSVYHPLESLTRPLLDTMAQIQRKLHMPRNIDRVAFRRRDGGGDGSAQACPPRGASVTFDEVCFAYPADPERLVLDRVSFHVPAGSFAAIVGESGCGKSTIVALLLRVYDITSGRILVDGVDVRTMAPRQLRRRLGFVGQACGLLPLRVDQNLLVGAPESTLSGQWAALERACVRDVIEQRPGQLHAPVSPSTLSGGERQRMVLARALARLAPSGTDTASCSNDLHAFVLDEATSALDVVTERRVQRALSGVGITTIAIAHRLATVRAATTVVVLGAGGRVLETGSFAELSRRGASGALAGYVRAQSAADAGNSSQMRSSTTDAVTLLDAAIASRSPAATARVARLRAAAIAATAV